MSPESPRDHTRVPPATWWSRSAGEWFTEDPEDGICSFGMFRSLSDSLPSDAELLVPVGPLLALAERWAKARNMHLAHARRVAWRRREVPGLTGTDWVSAEAGAKWSRLLELYPLLVEVPLPDYDAAVAADEAARKVTEATR